MKCLTVHQPWAWAIVSGLKQLENRTWRTEYRGPLLIHAGNSRKSLADGTALLDALAIARPDQLVFGAILGSVTLSDIVPFDERLAGDPFASGPYCWRLTDASRWVRPVPLVGQRSLYDVPDRLLRGAQDDGGNQVFNHEPGRRMAHRTRPTHRRT